jgi:ABC-type uncharacterized transport system substrate-binding protein
MRKHTWVIAISLGLGCASPALAHPHIFVDARTGFIFNEAGQLSALRIHWTYDAFTSLTLFDILDLDKDNDGALDDTDRAAIVAGETEWQDDYKGDTYLEADGADVPLAKPLNGSAWLADDRISVAFDLPLQAPLDVTDEVLLKLYDPSYYYAYTVVGLEETDMGDCLAELRNFEPDAATAELQAELALLSREETPEQENVGRLFADEVRLRCP